MHPCMLVLVRASSVHGQRLLHSLHPLLNLRLPLLPEVASIPDAEPMLEYISYLEAC